MVGFGFTIVFDRREERSTNKGQKWQVGKSEDAGSGSSSWREREKHHLQETKTAAAAKSQRWRCSKDVDKLPINF